MQAKTNPLFAVFSIFVFLIFSGCTTNISFDDNSTINQAAGKNITISVGKNLSITSPELEKILNSTLGNNTSTILSDALQYAQNITKFANKMNASSYEEYSGNLSYNSTSPLRAYYFYSEECAFCKDTEKYLKKLLPLYNSSDFQLVGVELYYNGSNRDVYENFTSAFNVSKNLHVVPMVFIDDTYIYTNGSIKERLETLVNACLKSQNCSDPAIKAGIAGLLPSPA